MFKRFSSLVIAAFFIISFLPISLIDKVYAFDSSKYFTDLKVGLVSISSTSLTVTLNGQYKVNEQVYPDGTVLNLGISGTNITLNGTSYTQVSFMPSNQSGLLTISSSSITAKYTGTFLFKAMNGKVFPINIVNIEDYLKGVVAYEMSDSFPLEALKAQAVAARNYALSRIGYESAKGYDFDDTTAYQVYKGFSPNYINSISAVDGTKGQVLLYNGNLVETLYSAWHGGVSENSENVWGNNVPYLRSVIDNYESDPWPNGNRTLTNAQIQSTLVSKGYLVSSDTFIKLDLSSITKYPSGRVSNINMVYKNSSGVQGTKSITADRTRTFLGLPSNMYSVSYDSGNGTYSFSGKGNGHGLGMSQIGAKNRAAAGQTFDQVLKFYYQGTNLQNLIQKAAISSTDMSSSNLLIGDNQTINTTATAGNGQGYLYKYIIKNSSGTVLATDYSSTSSMEFIPTTAGAYSVEAYVKDRFSVYDFDDRRVLNFTVYNGPVLNSFTMDKPSVHVGQTINMAASAQEGSGSFLYRYEVNRDGELIATTEFMPNNQFAFTPDKAGSYKVTAFVKDAVSRKSYDDYKALQFNAYEYSELSSFTEDKIQLLKNQQINFTASSIKGSGKYLYKFNVMKNSIKITETDYNSANTFNYIPNEEGVYTVNVYVRDTLSDREYDAAGTLTFTVLFDAKVGNVEIDKTAILTGQSINLKATAQQGSGDYLYRYVIKSGQGTLYSSDYSSSNTLAYKFENEGNYDINVYVKDALSSKDYDDVKASDIIVYVRPSMVLTGTLNQVLIGGEVRYYITASGGSGNFKYRYVVMQGLNKVYDSSYTDSKDMAFTPAFAGGYEIKGYVKDGLSEKEYDAQAVQTLEVYDRPAVSSYSGDRNEMLIGQTASYTIKAVGGSGAYIYKFVVMKDSSTIASVDYSGSNTFSYTPGSIGVYQVYGYVKDNLSLNSYDEVQELSLKVYSKPHISSSVLTGYYYEGKPINISSNVSGGSPYSISYRYEVLRNGTLITSNTFGTSNTFNFTPSSSGNYTVRTYVKDALSSNSYDDMKEINISISSKPLYIAKLPLSQGMSGSDVTNLQNTLIKLGYSISSATGYFGSQTYNAVVSFQKSKGLAADGIVGNATYSMLNDALIAQSGIKTVNY